MLLEWADELMCKILAEVNGKPLRLLYDYLSNCGTTKILRILIGLYIIMYKGSYIKLDLYTASLGLSTHLLIRTTLQRTQQ